MFMWKCNTFATSSTRFPVDISSTGGVYCSLCGRRCITVWCGKEPGNVWDACDVVLAAMVGVVFLGRASSFGNHSSFTFNLLRDKNTGILLYSCCAAYDLLSRIPQNFFIFIYFSKYDGTLLKTGSHSAGQSVSFSNYSIHGLVMSSEKNKPQFKKNYVSETGSVPVHKWKNPEPA